MRDEKQTRGSLAAKSGFQTEVEVQSKFNNWKDDADAQKWLEIMGYDQTKITEVIASKVPKRFKSDAHVQVSIQLQDLQEVQNISIKLVKSTTNFNQVDKRWSEIYIKNWNIPDDIAAILRLYSGEEKHNLPNARDKRRLFLTEFSVEDQNLVIDFFTLKKVLIVTDIIKGRGPFCAEWMLVIDKLNDPPRWALKDINQIMQFFSEGPIQLTKRGSLKIGRITMQRKGGDKGRPTASMLQFKIGPLALFDITLADEEGDEDED